MSKHIDGWTDRIAKEICDKAEDYCANFKEYDEARIALCCFLALASMNISDTFNDGDELEDIIMDKLEQLGIDWSLALDRLDSVFERVNDAQIADEVQECKK